MNTPKPFSDAELDALEDSKRVSYGVFLRILQDLRGARHALLEYGEHKTTCGMRLGTFGKLAQCTCGLLKVTGNK